LSFQWAGDLLVFLAISIVLGGVGMGGGAFYVPLLLALGYGYPEASSTSLFLIMITGLSAFSRFRRARLVDWKLAVVMDVFTDLGAFVGGSTAVHIDARYLQMAFGVVLVFASIGVLRIQGKDSALSIGRSGFGWWRREFNGFAYSLHLPTVIPLTFAIGYLSGALGIAGGLLKVPVMILWFAVPAKVAVATSSLMVGLTGLFGFGGHVLTGSIDWPLCLGVSAVVLLGGQIGSHISISLPERRVKQVLAAVLLLVAAWMIGRVVHDGREALSGAAVVRPVEEVRASQTPVDGLEEHRQQNE